MKGGIRLYSQSLNMKHVILWISFDSESASVLSQKHNPTHSCMHTDRHTIHACKEKGTSQRVGTLVYMYQLYSSSLSVDIIIVVAI